MHLASSIHDVTCSITDIWCAAREWNRRNATEVVEQVTCLACLNQAALFGNDCRRRYRCLLSRTVP